MDNQGDDMWLFWEPNKPTDSTPTQVLPTPTQTPTQVLMTSNQTPTQVLLTFTPTFVTPNLVAVQPTQVSVLSAPKTQGSTQNQTST